MSRPDNILRAPSQRVPAATSPMHHRAAAGFASASAAPSGAQGDPATRQSSVHASRPALADSHTRGDFGKGVSGSLQTGATTADVAAPSHTSTADERAGLFCSVHGCSKAKELTGAAPSVTAAERPFARPVDAIDCALSERERFDGYANAAPWSSEAR